MRRFNGMDYGAWTLTIVGALNWLLVGAFQFDLVAALFGGSSAPLARVVYVLVGLCGIYSAYSLTKLGAPDRSPAL